MDTTPHELFYSTKPRVDNLRIFGCSAMVWVPADKRGKFERVNEDGIMVGYAPHTKAWRILVETDEGFEIRETQNVSSYKVASIQWRELQHIIAKQTSTISLPTWCTKPRNLSITVSSRGNAPPTSTYV